MPMKLISFHGVMISICAPCISVQWSIFISEFIEGMASIDCTTKCGNSTLRIHGIINNQRCVVEWLLHEPVCNRFDSEARENVLPYNHIIGISRNLQYFTMGPANGLAPAWCQAITWTNEYMGINQPCPKPTPDIPARIWCLNADD